MANLALKSGGSGFRVLLGPFGFGFDFIHQKCGFEVSVLLPIAFW